MKLRPPSLLLSLGALGACASIPETPPDLAATPTTADYHRITVTEGAQRLEIAAPADAHELSAQDRMDLREFAGAYLRTGHGALVLSAPAGAANAEAANKLADDARMALGEYGVSYAAIAGSTYEAGDRADAPILISFARFEAVAPECTPLYRQDLAHQSNNQPWESFGCATQANFAALVEDPHDLLAPRGEDARDSDRRETVLQAYRAGDQTHADRSQDERVTLSNAVQ